MPHELSGTYTPPPIATESLPPTPRIRFDTDTPEGTSVTVEYAITDLGRTLAATLEPLRLWAEGHMVVIEQARADFDRRQQAAA